MLPADDATGWRSGCPAPPLAANDRCIGWRSSSLDSAAAAAPVSSALSTGNGGNSAGLDTGTSKELVCNGGPDGAPPPTPRSNAVAIGLVLPRAPSAAGELVPARPLAPLKRPLAADAAGEALPRLTLLADPALGVDVVPPPPLRSGGLLRNTCARACAPAGRSSTSGTLLQRRGVASSAPLTPPMPAARLCCRYCIWLCRRPPPTSTSPLDGCPAGAALSRLSASRIDVLPP